MSREKTSRGYVPTGIYSRLLDQRGRDVARIEALEAMLRDACLVCQAGRPDGDSLVIRVMEKRVLAWKSVLNDTEASSAATR